jgi:hypothetical protein
LKGYLFASGEYWPFQDYGFWTNHMPFSFLIPGWVQELFGPGLRTGRYFAIFLSAMILIGIWILGSRLGNQWWAAVLIWLFALNGPAIKTYSVMGSQGLVAFMLVWILVLTIGPGRKLWHLVLGTLLAALLMLTRINMSPVLPIVVLYIFWEHGKKAGLWAAAAGLFGMGVGHAFFWPGILRLWAKWLPSSLTPFLSAYRPPLNAYPKVDPDINIYNRVVSFLQGFRFHFFAIVGSAFSWLVWPTRKNWQSEWRFRASVFLSVLFGLLFVLHMWASLWNTYCVFCFRAYLFFFFIPGVLLIPLTISNWKTGTHKKRKWFGISLMILFSLMMAYNASLVWGNNLITNQFVRQILTWQVPRMDGINFLPGSVKLWGLLSNKFGWPEDQIFQVTTIALRRSVPGLIVLLMGGVIFYYSVKKIRVNSFSSLDNGPRSLPINPMYVFLIIGGALSIGMGFAPQEADCGWDVIASYEAGGEHLSDHVPAGSKIYWNGGLTAVPLLYLTDFQIYPPQINNGYTFRRGGDADELIRYGWWNEELAQQWRLEADVFLIEGWRQQVDGETFDEIEPTLPLLPCKAKTEIHIYLRR